MSHLPPWQRLEWPIKVKIGNFISPCLSTAKDSGMEKDSETKHRERAFQILTGICQTQLVYTLLTNNVFETIDDGECSLMKIAAKCQLHEKYLERCLRYGRMLGLIHLNGENFALTDTGKYFLKKNMDGFYDLVDFLGSPPCRESWNNFEYSLTTGNAAFEDVFGIPFSEYRAINPVYNLLYIKFLQNDPIRFGQQLAESYPFDSFRTFYEIGTRKGCLMNTIFENTNGATGVLFPVDSSNTDPAGSERIKIVDEISPVRQSKVDCVIINSVMGLWSDVTSFHILNKCRLILKAGGKLILIARLVEEEPPFDAKTIFLDLHLHLLCGGMERTSSQIIQLLQRAGLRLAHIYPTGTPLHLLECDA